MAIRLALFGATLLLWPGIASAARVQASATAATLLRHYALSACLAQAFPAIRDEALASQDAALQSGSHPAETYQAIQRMAERWLQREYPSFKPVTLDVMKCIDFAESREVGALARSTLPK